MTKPAKPIEPSTLVTVRITGADGTTHTFHGTAMKTVSLHTGAWESAAGPRYNYVPAADAVGEGWEPAADWLRVYSATGNPFNIAHSNAGIGGPGTSLAPMSADYFFGLYDFHVRLDSPNVDVRVATKTGREWVQANQYIDDRRQRLVEQVTALDPDLGEAVDRLLGDVEDDAFDRDKDAEWHFRND